MQLAEEKQSGWLQVPRIGYYAFASTDVRGGGSLAEEYMDRAIKAAKRQWANGVALQVEMIGPIFEPLEGELRFNERGGVEGPARATFPDGYVYEGNHKGGRKHGQGTAKFATGDMYVGQFENDKRHGRGTFTYANGNVFQGDYQNGLMHGRGTFTWANGNVEVGFYEEGKDKGPGVRLEKASGHFWLLKDGQQVRKIDPTEAWSSFFWVVSNLCWRQAKEVVKEHGLPELPW